MGKTYNVARFSTPSDYKRPVKPKKVNWKGRQWAETPAPSSKKGRSPIEDPSNNIITAMLAVGIIIGSAKGR